MNIDNRNATRVYPKDFIDYAVQVESQGFNYNGYLGNVSETGMCGILPLSFTVNKGESIKGHIHHIPLDDHIDFSGKVVWSEEYQFQKKQHVMIGVQFLELVELPDYLFALSLSFEG